MNTEEIICPCCDDKFIIHSGTLHFCKDFELIFKSGATYNCFEVMCRPDKNQGIRFYTDQDIVYIYHNTNDVFNKIKFEINYSTTQSIINDLVTLFLNLNLL